MIDCACSAHSERSDQCGRPAFQSLRPRRFPGPLRLLRCTDRPDCRRGDRVLVFRPRGYCSDHACGSVGLSTDTCGPLASPIANGQGGRGCSNGADRVPRARILVGFWRLSPGELAATVATIARPDTIVATSLRDAVASLESDLSTDRGPPRLPTTRSERWAPVRLECHLRGLGYAMPHYAASVLGLPIDAREKTYRGAR